MHADGFPRRMKIYRTPGGHVVEQEGVLRHLVGDLFGQ